jgi:hypothetical protein
MRTKEENDQLFQNLMKLKSNFIWRDHIITLTGESVHVSSEKAFQELLENTTDNFHKFIHLIN